MELPRKSDRIWSAVPNQEHSERSSSLISLTLDTIPMYRDRRKQATLTSW